MLIDWFTVAAQALNFLILVWLMRKFLYRPILQAIDARERQTATTVADAQAKDAAAVLACAQFKAKNDEFDRDVAERRGKVTEEAASERQRLLDEARKAGDEMRTKYQEAVQEEAQSLNQAFITRAQQEVVAIARKALTDLASAHLEGQVGEVFIRRVRTLEGKAKDVIATALASSSGPAVVRSSFAPTADQRAGIQQALNETFSREIALRFETAPELICGVEFVARDQKVAWNIADYLRDLETGLSDLVHRTDPQKALTGNRHIATATVAAPAHAHAGSASADSIDNHQTP
jgi:F-type H+-transporting ATPase subunit b